MSTEEYKRRKENGEHVFMNEVTARKAGAPILQAHPEDGAKIERVIKDMESNFDQFTAVVVHLKDGVRSCLRNQERREKLVRFSSCKVVLSDLQKGNFVLYQRSCH